MSQFQDLQGLVETSIGGRNDSIAVTVIQVAINYAIILASLIFKPPELKSITPLTYVGGSSYLDISSVNWIAIHLLSNDTDGIQLGFIPYDKLDVIVPSSLTSTKYWSMFGDKLFLRAAPTANKALSMSCSLLPSTLAQPTDPIPFSGYDSTLVSWATMLTQAAFEEAESAGAWMKIAETIGAPLTMGAKERDIIEGAQAYFDLTMLQAKGGK
jgi:hypothetical protein